MPISRFVVVASLLMASAASAQDKKAPSRPALPPGADTADAAAYLEVGASTLTDNPSKAADAFYWASRLEPEWAEPLYGRRLALLLTDKTRLQRYMEDDKRTLRSSEIQQIDSLQFHALMRNPFMYRRFDRVLLEQYFKAIYEEAYGRGQVNQAALAHWINQYTLDAGPITRAMDAYTSGRLADALGHYTTAIKRRKESERAFVYAERARIYFLLSKADSAAADLKRAVDALRVQDEKRVVYVYDSKALFEQSIGLIHEQARRWQDARDSYARALQEDLTYYPAHIGSARVAMATNDTAAALASLELAVQSSPDNAIVQMTYGSLLLSAGRSADAEAALRKAIALEPYFAQPYLLLAQSLESAGNKSAALTSYRAFVERANRTNAARASASQRIAQLEATEKGQ